MECLTLCVRFTPYSEYGRSPFVGTTENHQDDLLDVYRVKISTRGRGFAKRGRGGADVGPRWGRVGTK